MNPSKCSKNSTTICSHELYNATHAHIGSYYDYFNIIEPKSCICDAALQTREHILSSCTHFVNHQHILEDDSGTIHLSDVLASTEGIKCLAKFITEAGAYNKPPTE